ncbi:MAG: glycosyltransferase family 39 protein, partial [Candidatus Eisenbacteria bacterium]
MNTSKRPPVDTRRRANSSTGSASARGAAFPRLESATWAWLVPALVALALYARTLGHAFVWDDLDLIVRNAALQGPDWAVLLAQDFWQSTGAGTGMWRPLVTLSYRLDGVLGGWQPWNFHAVNVVLHATSAALVARLALARGLNARAALAAGVVFASAPALCEPVAWIAGRTDGFVVLATLVALLAAARARDSGSRGALLVVALATAVALLAKETALVLPVLLAAQAADARDRAPLGERMRWASAGVSLVVVAGGVVAHRALVGAPAHAGEPGAALGMAALLWAHFAWLTPFVPHVSLLDVWQAPATAMSIAAWLALLALAAGTVALTRRRRAAMLILALLVLPLVPVVAAALLESGVRFAERSLALPAVGLALGLATLAAALPWRRAAWVVVAIWTVAQLVVTVPLVATWRDDEARIRRVVAVRPRDPDALLGLADLLSSQGRANEASELIARAEAVAPSGDASAWVARASTEFRAGRLEPAVAAAEQALARDRGSLAAGVVRV